MADEGKKKSASKSTAEEQPAGLNPTPVYIGGESIADRIIPHIKKILIGVVIVAVIVTIFFTVRWFQRNKAEKSTDAVISAVTEGRRDIEEPDLTKEPDPDEPVEVTYASRAERAEAVLTSLKKAKGDPRSGVAMLEAGALLEAGRLDEAEAAYKKLSGKQGLEGVVAREALGFVAEARPDLPAALEAFRAMQPDDAGPRRAFALYHEGRILAQMGKKDEARKAFDAALDKSKEVGESMLTEMVEARLIQLDAPPLAATPAPEAPKP
jgi:tetratricopeptide (TPR) repeat protein